MMYQEITKEEFSKHLIKMRTRRNIEIFFDLETLQYNEKEGRKKPTKFKNSIYSLAISYFYNDVLYIVLYPSFKGFFETIFTTYQKWKTLPSFELIAHNNNKYDNHFLRQELIEEYDIEYRNQFLNNSIESGNVGSIKIGDLTKEEVNKGVMLEKRVKSKNNLELTIYKNNIKFYTTDNYMKTNTSIDTLGKKLLKLNLITDEELKTDFNYTRYHREEDLTDFEVKEYSREVFYNLDEDERKYIVNDVVILAYSVIHFSKLFKGFDYEKITFTSNILETYNQNDLTSYQLLKKVGKGRNELPINYTDYKFNNQNFYDYLKSFYNGGLNFYNFKYIGQIIEEDVFGMDINSSYPYIMHKKKIPTYLKSFKEFEFEEEINIRDIEKQKDTYTLYRMSKLAFDDLIITRIKSKVIKQILVKYYSNTETININSYTLKMIENITDLKIDRLKVFSYVTFKCEYFGGNNILEDYYRIKTQGQNKYKLNMDSLYNIYETDIENKEVYSDEEIDISKVNLNGLYGIPALRPYFNLFRWRGGKLVNVENGFMNSQRNILFSIFVTSGSLYNLLDPLSYLTDEEIDDNFLYCDTDSLYWKKKITHKFPSDLFDPNNLGKWDVQNEIIDKFYTLNHKKYAYLEDGEITVKAGGIPNEAFDRDLDFKTFIDTQFCHGVTIKNTKGIYNEQGTISIYESETLLELGKPYRNFAHDPDYTNKKEKLFKLVKEELEENDEDGLYIESNIGTFSITELYPVIHEVDSKRPLDYLMLKESFIYDRLQV